MKPKNSSSPKSATKKRAPSRAPASDSVLPKSPFTYDENEPDSDAPPPTKFEMIGERKPFPSVSRIALLASIILKGFRTSDIDNAVRAALQIYDTAYVWEYEDSLERSVLSQARDEFGYILYKDHYSYKEAAKEVTGQVRPKRAIEYLEDYGFYIVSKNPDLKSIEERVAFFEKRLLVRQAEGFKPEEVLAMKKGFSIYFPTRRKKSLDF